MASLKPLLNALLRSLPPGPIDKAALDSLVRETLSHADAKSNSENRKAQWEYVLKEQILTLAVRTISFVISTLTMNQSLVKRKWGTGRP